MSLAPLINRSPHVATRSHDRLVMHRIKFLLKAQQSLRQRNDLRTALQFWWRAMIDVDEWPSELQQESQRLSRLVFRNGKIKTTLEQMSEDEKDEVKSILCELIALARRLSDTCEDVDPSAPPG